MNKLLKVYLTGVELTVVLSAFGMGTVVATKEDEDSAKILKQIKTRPMKSLLEWGESCVLWPLDLAHALGKYAASRTKHTK